jgi:L-ascorbate metabolism protein UlaG (beta-lactamase superfamily)
MKSPFYEDRLKRVDVPVIHNHYEHIFRDSLRFLDGPVALYIACEMIADLLTYIKETDGGRFHGILAHFENKGCFE